ncbi:unnamed protein product, partial [Musa acuminata var. zebrina]
VKVTLHIATWGRLLLPKIFLLFGACHGSSNRFVHQLDQMEEKHQEMILPKTTQGKQAVFLPSKNR